MDTVFGMLGSEDAKNLLSNLKTLLDIAKLLVPVIIAVALTIGAVALLLFLEFNVMEYDYFVLLSVIVVATDEELKKNTEAICGSVLQRDRVLI